VRGAWDDGEFGVGQVPVHRDRVLGTDLVVVADHDQGSHRDLPQVGLG